jgi:hypothetical protein
VIAIGSAAGVAIALALFGSGVAIADDAKPDEPKPWAKDVPEPVQKEAEKLYDEANQLFAQQRHAPAIEKYRGALKLWDHPLIQFNLAVTLIRVNQPLEASDALDNALRYGPLPFKTKELYNEALNYQGLLKNQVGYIEVSCDQPGTSITLDGKKWFDCPDSKKLRVLAGEHTIVGDKQKFVPKTRRVVVAGGATSTELIALEPIDSRVKVVYPYARWIPWTITALGGVVALSGVGVYLAGRSQMASFRRNYADDCVTGCEKDLSMHPALRDQRDSAELKGAIGVTMIVAGGATAIGGLVFALAFNNAKQVLPLEVAPTGGGMRAAVGWRF